MKTNYFLILLLTLNISVYAKTYIISLKIYSEKPIRTQVYEPINGYYNRAFERKEFFQYEDSCYIKGDLSNPSFVMLYFTFIDNNKFVARCDLLIFPGDSVHIVINPFKSEAEWINFYGSNAQAHQLFSNINFHPARKFSPVRELIKNYQAEKGSFFKKLYEIIDSLVHPFDSLAKNKMVNIEYYNLIKKNLRLLYYDEILMKLVLYPSKALQSLPWHERDRIAKRIIKKIPLGDKGIRSLFNADLYLETVSRYFACKKLKFKSGYELNREDTIVITQYKQTEIVDKELTHLLYIKEPLLQRDLWAIVLANYFQVAVGYFNEKIIDQYSRLFPFNPYDQLLRNLLRKSGRKIDSVFLAFTSPKRIIDSLGKLKTIYSVPQLTGDSLSHFLIDIWASWCAPCIEEFLYNRSLESFLIKHNIKRLYISLDNFSGSNNWDKAINKYKLGGYHILAGEEIRNEIQNLLFLKRGEPIPIPRYFILDTNRNIIKISTRPSDEAAFTEEIQLLINEKEN